MAIIIQKDVPSIFNAIIKQRVSDYINKEVKELVQKKTDEIISDVLSNLQADAEMYKDMLSYETRLVVKAVYNGKDIQQNGGDEIAGDNHEQR